MVEKTLHTWGPGGHWAASCRLEGKGNTQTQIHTRWLNTKTKYTHIQHNMHSNTHIDPHSDATTPAAVAAGGVRCLQAREPQHKDRRLPGCLAADRSDRSICSLSLHSCLFILPFFPQSTPLFYFYSPSLTVLFGTNSSWPDPKDPNLHLYYSLTTYHPCSPSFASSFDTHTQAYLPPHRAKASERTWLAVILLTVSSSSWVWKQSKLKWQRLPSHTERHSLPNKTRCVLKASYVSCTFLIRSLSAMIKESLL